MLPRVHRSRPHSFTSASQIRSKSPQNKRVQNVLKKNEKEKRVNSVTSYFLRIIWSGILIGLIILVFAIYRQISLAHLDVDTSYTRLYIFDQEQQSIGIVMSLRGKEKGISTVLLEPQSELMLFPSENISTLGSVLQRASVHELAFQLGIPIDEIVHVNNKELLTVTKSNLLMLANPFTSNGSVGFVDRMKIWWYIFRLDPSLITQKNVSILSKDQPLNISDEGYLQFVKAFCADTQIRSQGVTIAIINTTKQNGLAKKIADILSSWGFQVIHIDSVGGDNPKSQLIRSNELSAQMSQRVESLFAHSIEKKDDEHILEQYRSQFVLFVGDDILPQLDTTF